MSKQPRRTKNGFTKHLPRLSLLALAIAGMSQVQAADFELGDFNLKVDSKLSLGSSWRVEKRNNDYISRGTVSNTAATNPSYQGSQTNNTDDGNMNFDKGDAFSQVITGDHTLNLTHNEYRNVGAKVSFRYWYDHALNELDGAKGNGQRNNWKNASAFDDAKSGIELMDAYIWGDFDLAGRPAQAILGRHVLNWGESTFIQGGQNAANPIDVQALRRPGAELRDALLPVNMLSGSIALDEMGNFNLEGYYQLEWERTRADACGTYFSNNDFAAEGCGPVYLYSDATESAPPLGSLDIAARNADLTPSGSGQYGIAVKWYAEGLNGTEFGFSYQNIHSRLPYASGIIPTTPGSPVTYTVEFPEDQKVFAASFATLLSTGTAWSGELTYRPDAPIQINPTDILTRGGLARLPSLQASCNPTTDIRCALLPSEIQALGPGYRKGYREFDVFQFQTTFLHDFNRVLAADNLRLIGEVGFTYVNNLPDTKDIRFGRSSVYGSFGQHTDDPTAAITEGVMTGTSPIIFADNGYVTELSWGYRLVGQLEYTNALISGLTLKPTLSWSHDVSGYGPEPGSQFYEGRMILGTALAAEYMNTYTANLSYTNYFDTDYWDLDDRDFVSLSVGVNF